MTDAFDPALFPDRLNLGCGYDIRAGYLNVDVNDFHSPDLVADVTNLHMLPAGRYREILAQDVLEHLPRTATVDVLREWNRLLTVGGTVHLRVPSVLDLSLLLRAPENQSVEMQEKLIQCLFGTQAYSEDTHLTTFTEPLLRHYLDEAGFAVVTWGAARPVAVRGRGREGALGRRLGADSARSRSRFSPGVGGAGT